MINPAEAEVVRQIFRRYLELGCVRLLKEELDRRGVSSKSRCLANGVRQKGYSFSRGALYVVLSNPLYVGEIRHRGVRHRGQHQPIIDLELWEKVQQQLHEHAKRRRLRAVKVEPSPLAGKLFDSSGAGLTPSHARKGERRYRYYISRGLTIGPAHRVHDGWRLPAPEIERTVTAAVQQLLTGRGRGRDGLSAPAANRGNLPPIRQPNQATRTREHLTPDEVQRMIKGAPPWAAKSPIIREMRERGLSIAKTAAELNEREVPTTRGKRWRSRAVLPNFSLRRDASVSVANEGPSEVLMGNPPGFWTGICFTPSGCASPFRPPLRDTADGHRDTPERRRRRRSRTAHCKNGSLNRPRTCTVHEGTS